MSRAVAGSGRPAWAWTPRGAGRPFYGWILVAALGVTELVSYGVLCYAFPVLLAPMEAELGWSRTQTTGAFSLALLVSGLAAVPVGRWVDRRGARLPMTLGSVAAALLLLAWSRVEGLAAFYLVWVGLGVAMAAVLYEPAFAVVAHWFVRRRSAALTLLTFVGGLASVVFVPLATWLVAAHGWRSALVWLSAAVALLTVPLHALLLRHRPSDLGLEPDGAPVRAPAAPVEEQAPPTATDVRMVVRGAPFLWLSLAFALSAVCTTALSVHLIPLLMERGFSAAFAAGAMGGLGLLALPGRLVFTPLGDRWPRVRVAAAIFVLQAVGIAVLLAGGGAVAITTAVALIGAGFGAITPARAGLVADLYGPARYGRINGVLAMQLSFARAAAPLGASLLYAAAGGYRAVLVALLAASVVSALAVLRSAPPLPSPLTFRSPA